MKTFLLKKTLIAALLMLILFSLSACGSAEEKAPDPQEDKLNIVTTIFPEFDWVRNITKETTDTEVMLLLDNGVDLHSYQPTAADILSISTCDVFVYVGGESDEWVDDVLKDAVNKDMIVINLLEILGDKAKVEETVEGMEAEEDEHEDDADGEEDAHEEELDEHVWLSLKNAAFLVEKIEEALAGADPYNAALYKENAESYIEKLNALDEEYNDAVSKASVKTLLFGDRFPFRYMVDDYGLTYYAAFSGCSAETEASFETITFLSNKVDELLLDSVMTIEGSDHRVAETIVNNTRKKDQKILTLDSMQSKTAKEIGEGASYISIMENNLSILKEALH